MSAAYLQVEEAIHRTMATIMAASELLDATLTNPSEAKGDSRSYLLTDAQVDARLEVMSHAVEQATGLRDLFQAYMRRERQQGAKTP